jgi:hypothetical protein
MPCSTRRGQHFWRSGGTASTKHGRVIATFARMIEQQSFVDTGILTKAYDLYAQAHYGTQDLRVEGKALRAQMRPFLDLCARSVEERARA